jgi:hypothetical protein
VARDTEAATSTAPCRVIVPVPLVKVLAPEIVVLPFSVLAPVEVWKVPVALWASKAPLPAVNVRLLLAARVVSPF